MCITQGGSLGTTRPFPGKPDGFLSIRGKEEGGFLGSCPPQSSSVPMPRYERLEEQLNDLTELHQNEMTNLKQELASMEEKVAYQSYERARDIQVGQRQGSAPRCALHPRHQGGGQGTGRGQPFSCVSTFQVRSLLGQHHSEKLVPKPCPQNTCLCPSTSP